VSTENQTVRDIMLPLSAFPCLKESGTVQEATFLFPPLASAFLIAPKFSFGGT